MERVATNIDNETDDDERVALNSNVIKDNVVNDTNDTNYFILHPFGIYRTIWDIFVMIILIYTCIEVPFTLAFNITLTLKTFSGIIALLIDISLLIDIYFNFRTAYFDKFDPFQLITKPSEISKQYIKTWFFLDLFTSFPLEFLLPNQSNGTETMRAIKMLRIFRLFRLLKLLRFFRMVKTFNNLLRGIFTRSVVIILKLFRIICLMILTAHYTACIWWYSGHESLKYFDESWIANDKLNMLDSDDVTVTQQYIKSFYFAVVTLFTTGFGDITPINTMEEVVGSIVIIVGTILFAYFIASVSDLMTEDDHIRSAQVRKMEEAQAFCAANKLPTSLSIQVMAHLKYYWSRNLVFDGEQVIKCLPPQMQQSVADHCDKQYFVDQLSIFKHLSTYIRGLVALKLKSISCPSDTYLFKQHHVGQKLYIQRTGSALITSAFNEAECIKSERGTVCGFFSFIKPQRESALKTISYSEFWELDYCDLLTILQKTFPKTWQNIWSLIKNEIEELYDKQQIYLNTKGEVCDKSKTMSARTQWLNINNDENIRDQNVKKTAKKIKGALNYQKEIDLMQKQTKRKKRITTNKKKKVEIEKAEEEETKCNVDNKQLLTVPVTKPRKKIKKRKNIIKETLLSEVEDEDESSFSNSMFGENSLNSLSKSIPMNVAMSDGHQLGPLLPNKKDRRKYSLIESQSQQ